MLNRLITALFAVGLLLAFVGLAVADNSDGLVHKAIPTGQRLQSSHSVKYPYVAPGFQKGPADADAQMLSGNLVKGGIPQAAGPDTSGCDFIDYWDPNTTFNVTWTRLGGDPRQVGMRFDAPKHHAAEVNGGFVWLSQASGLGANVNFVVRVFDDAGGLPGNMLHMETFSVPSGSPPDYYPFYFASPVSVPGGTFYITFSADPAAPASDTVKFLSDDGGADPSFFGLAGTAQRNGRSVYFDGTTWFAALDFFGGLFDPNYDFFADFCFFFSFCQDVPAYVGGSFLLPIPDDPVNGYLASIGAPLPGGETWNGVGQRFVSEGPETLKTIKFNVLDVTAIGFPPQSFYGPASTNGIILSIWPDDGAGGIDQVAGPLASVTIPGGLANIFPYTNNDGSGATVWDTVAADLSAFNLVMIGPWHATAEMTSDNAADGSVWIGWDAAGGLGGGSVNMKTAPPADNWETMATSVEWQTWISGEDNAAKMTVERCQDEFFQCQTQLAYVGGLEAAWGLPLNIAAKFQGTQVNRLEKVRWQYVDPALFGQDGMDYQQQIVVWADNNGMPGAELWRSPVLDTSQLVGYPGWNELVIPGGLQILGDFFVGYEDASTNPNAFFYYGTEESQPEIRTGAKYFSTGSGIWKDLGDVVASNENAIIEADFCSIPLQERSCAPGDDWVTLGHDFARTSASGNAVGTAQCDLDLTWTYKHPSMVTNFASPIIYNNTVIQSFSGATSSEYVLLDLSSGAVLSTINTAAYPNALGGIVRCTPTVTDLLGFPVLLVAGGNKNAFSAFDISNPAAPVLLWSINSTNGWLGHVGGTTGIFNLGTIRYGTATVVMVNGTDPVVYFTDDDGNVLAANLADGTPYAGFDQGLGGGYKPFQLPGNALKSGSTDGSHLFFALFANTPGDVVALNLDGSLAWQLSATDGLQGGNIDFAGGPGTTNEAFQCGIAYDGGAVYTNSAMSFPDGGVMYSIDATTGSVIWAAKSNRVLLSSPVVDANAIYMPTQTTIVGTQIGGDLPAFKRDNGSLLWAFTTFAGAFDTRYDFDPVLSCEPGKPDLLFAGTVGGYLSCIDVSAGEEVFHRRLGWGTGFANIMFGGALAPDGGGASNLVITDGQGTVYDLRSSGTARPRLEVVSDHIVVPVEFGTPSGTVFTFPDIATNTGCADLNLTLTASDVSNGSIGNVAGGGTVTVASVRSDFAEATSSLADRLTAGFNQKKAAVREAPSFNLDENRSPLTSNRLVNHAATAVPPYLLPMGPGGSVFVTGDNVVLAPGDTLDIQVYVDGPQISRGPQPFYVELASDDPDYWLNDGILGTLPPPEVQLTLQGGCLFDTTYLAFGDGGANFDVVANSGRTATGDFSSQSIDGWEALLFQGSYVYGITQHRLAMNTQNWWAGGGEADAWVSMQPDPNFFDQNCKPAIETGVSLGSISADGITYTPITGEVVYKNYIDSVQDFFDPGSGEWLWDVTGGGSLTPFTNDSTMGIAAQTRTFGAQLDATDPALAPFLVLNNIYIEIMDFHERNGNMLEGWKFGAFQDDDNHFFTASGTYDTVEIDRSISAAWAYPGDAAPGDIVANGWVKLPFGCGETPIKNILPIERAQSMTPAGGANVYWDSVYFYMSQPPGIPYGHNQNGADDQDCMITFVEKDTIQPNEQFSFAIGNFLFDGITDGTVADPRITEVCNLANKWVGFGRGDVNNDNVINLADIIYLSDHVNLGTAGPIPFMHLGDVNNDNAVDMGDVNYLVDFYFNYGPCPVGDWEL